MLPIRSSISFIRANGLSHLCQMAKSNKGISATKEIGAASIDNRKRRGRCHLVKSQCSPITRIARAPLSLASTLRPTATPDITYLPFK